MNKDFIFTSDFIGGGMISDINRDGFNDILYADKREIFMFLNKATGKIQFDKIRITSDLSPAKVFQEYDVDADGDQDVLIGASGKIMIFENKSTLDKAELVRSAKDLFFFGSFSTKIPAYFVADLNQDNLDDVLVAYGDTKIGFQKADKSFFIYDVPDGDFDNVFKVASNDLDGDGKPDFILARNNASGGAGLQYFLNSNNSFNFRRPAFQEPVRDFAFIDINQDSLPDLMTLDYKRKNAVYLFTNTGNPENLFQLDSTMVTLAANYSSFAQADLDNDNDEDLVIGFEQAAGIQMLLNGDEENKDWNSLTIPQSYGTSEKVLAGDLDNDGDEDVVQLLDDNGFLIYRNGLISSTSDVYGEWVSVYPNPSGETVTVGALSPLSSITVWGSDGRAYLSHREEGGSSTVRLDISGLMPGAYMLEITHASGEIKHSRMMVLR